MQNFDQCITAICCQYENYILLNNLALEVLTQGFISHKLNGAIFRDAEGYVVRSIILNCLFVCHFSVLQEISICPEGISQIQSSHLSMCQQTLIQLHSKMRSWDPP